MVGIIMILKIAINTLVLIGRNGNLQFNRLRLLMIQISRTLVVEIGTIIIIIMVITPR